MSERIVREIHRTASGLKYVVNTPGKGKKMSEIRTEWRSESMRVRRRMAKEDFPPSGKLELPHEPLGTIKYEGCIMSAFEDGEVVAKYTDPMIPNEFVSPCNGGMIKGLEEMLHDMREGEHRTVTVPPNKGYGHPRTFKKPEGVPWDSVLRLDISLEKISYTSLKEQNDK